MNRFVRLLCLAVAASAFTSLAQNIPPSDPQALAFAAQSIAAMTGGNAVTDVTLTGPVSWTLGSNTETGTATLMALGTGESSMSLALTSGNRSEIRDGSTSSGKWTAEDGTFGPLAAQNMYTDAVWFFPVLGSLAAGPNVVLTYIGAETWNGAAVQHIQSYVYQSGNPPDGLPPTQQLSTIDFYLDATTFLPAAAVFNSHPNTNPFTNFSVEIDFSNYQATGGITLPLHVQKILQGTVLVDLTITTAAFNTGLNLSNFSVN